MRRRGVIVTLAVSLLATASTAASAGQIGTIVNSDGLAEIGRGRPPEWTPVVAGVDVHEGEVLRTGTGGAIRVFLLDGSIVDVGEEAVLDLDAYVFAPQQGRFEALFELLSGKIRTLVSEYYIQRDAKFEISTPTSISGVRGTEFIVAYDPEERATEVIGISGTVAVNGLARDAEAEVLVTAQQRTRIAHGNAPTTPEKLVDRLFRQYMDGLELVLRGGGGIAGLASSDPIFEGSAVPGPERTGGSGLPSAAPPAPGPPASDPAGAARRFPYTPGDAAMQPAPVIELPGVIEIPL